MARNFPLKTDRDGDEWSWIKSMEIEREYPEMPGILVYSEIEDKIVVPQNISPHKRELKPYGMVINGYYDEIVIYDPEVRVLFFYGRIIDNIEADYWVLKLYRAATKIEKIFFGKSPKDGLTIRSGAYGPKYDGNTILYKQLNTSKYVGFNGSFFEFEPLAEIVEYVSPVGPNGVPYPYAIDVENNLYYFVSQTVIIDGGGDVEMLLNSKEYFDFRFKDEALSKNFEKVKLKIKRLDSIPTYFQALRGATRNSNHGDTPSWLGKVLSPRTLFAFGAGALTAAAAAKSYSHITLK